MLLEEYLSIKEINVPQVCIVPKEFANIQSSCYVNIFKINVVDNSMYVLQNLKIPRSTSI